MPRSRDAQGVFCCAPWHWQRPSTLALQDVYLIPARYNWENCGLAPPLLLSRGRLQHHECVHLHGVLLAKRGLTSCILILLFARAQQKRRRIETRRLFRATLNERGRKRERLSRLQNVNSHLYICVCISSGLIVRVHVRGVRVRDGHWLNGNGKWATNIVINRGLAQLLTSWGSKVRPKYGWVNFH